MRPQTHHKQKEENTCLLHKGEDFTDLLNKQGESLKRKNKTTTGDVTGEGTLKRISAALGQESERSDPSTVGSSEGPLCVHHCVL